MGPPARLPFLLVAASACLLLSVSARPGSLDFGAERHGARGILQDGDDQKPCLFLNGRFIGPCPQLSPSPEMPASPDTDKGMESPDTDKGMETPDTDKGMETPETDKGMGSPNMTASPTPEPDNGMEPPTVNPTNISGVLSDCSFNGSLVALLASNVGCMGVDRDCNPQAVVAFSADNETLTADLVNKIVEQACRTEAIASCSNMAFSSISADCKKTLDDGPPEPNDVCPDARAANEIFESGVSVFCEEQFTPPEEGN